MAPLSPRRLRTHLLHLRSRQNRPVDRRRDDDPSTAIADPTPITPASASLTQAAAPSNPHRRQPPTQPPAGSFLGAFGRRPSVHADRSPRAGIRNPSPQQSFFSPIVAVRSGRLS